MPEQYCFLCASDEGVFLDITADNLNLFGDQLEICLITKVRYEKRNVFMCFARELGKYNSPFRCLSLSVYNKIQVIICDFSFKFVSFPYLK